MKAALVVNNAGTDIDANLTAILNLANEAADAGADIVLFPEDALTGLANNDDPSHDLPLGQPIPGSATDRLAALARERRIWLAIGLLKREGSQLYDSAVLLTPDGQVRLKYRRIHPGWHGKNADPSGYCQGTEIAKGKALLGSFAFLICGDLFNDEILSWVQEIHPDWLLFPFCRSFSDGSCDQERWDREEKPEYVQRVKISGIATLMTNCLSHDGSFGGAMVVSGNGRVIAKFPLGKVGMLLVDL